MKNTIQDLNNYLFESLERLLDDELTEEQMQKEIIRSKAVTDVAGKIIENAALTLRTIQYMKDQGIDTSDKNLPKLLGVKSE